MLFPQKKFSSNSSCEPSNDDYKNVAVSLSQALSNCGFAYLTHHGIHQKTIDSCFDQSKNFFKLPQPVKDKFTRGVESVHGYSQKGREVLEKNVIGKSNFQFRISPLVTFHLNKEIC